jgi:hypothetical protein
MSDNATLPPPLLGCLICHAEGTLDLIENNRRFGSQYPTLSCTNCGSTALLDWKEGQGEVWRIRYRKISREFPYAFAAKTFLDANWLDSEEAIQHSTTVYIQGQRLKQIMAGDLQWLKPAPLNPPPPLMSMNEVVYLTLKPVSYCESAETRIPFMRRKESMIDTGTFYVTDSKIHLLGQRRDRSHRLAEIVDVTYDRDTWFVYLDIGGASHYYRGLSLPQLDVELIAGIINVLRSHSPSEPEK